MWSATFADCVAVNETAMRTQGPNLTYLTFQDGVRNAGTHWITDSPEFSDTFSWFLPGTKTGDHDMKRFRPGAGRTLDLTADVINVTNRANFVNPTADRRSTNFLLLTTLYGGGQPRQAQVGLRLGF